MKIISETPCRPLRHSAKTKRAAADRLERMYLLRMNDATSMRLGGDIATANATEAAADVLIAAAMLLRTETTQEA